MTIALIAAVFMTGAAAFIARNTDRLERDPAGGPGKDRHNV